MKLRTKQKTLLFLIFFAHITLLDFAFIGGAGNIVLLWQQSLELRTISVHLSIAVVSVLGFILFTRAYRYIDLSKPTPMARLFSVLSVIGMIGFGLTLMK